MKSGDKCVGVQFFVEEGRGESCEFVSKVCIKLVGDGVVFVREVRVRDSSVVEAENPTIVVDIDPAWRSEWGWVESDG